MNAVEKICSYCKRTGHVKENWSLNSKTKKKETAKKEIRYTAKDKKKKSRSDDSESLSDEKENRKKKKSVSVAEFQVELNATQAVLT